MKPLHFVITAAAVLGLVFASACDKKDKDAGSAKAPATTDESKGKAAPTPPAKPATATKVAPAAPTAATATKPGAAAAPVAAAGAGKSLTIHQLKAAACGCKDKACAMKVLDQFKVFFLANRYKRVTRSAAQAAKESSKLMTQCMMAKGLDAQTITAALKSVSGPAKK